MRICNIKSEDRILLLKAARGECSESLSEIYLKYNPVVCDFLRKSGAGDLVEDVCQTVFMNIFQGKCKYDGNSDPKNYLIGIANNIYKKALKTDTISTYGLSPKEIQDDLPVSQATSLCPLKLLTSEETRKVIIEAITNLPPKSHQAIKLVYIDEIPPFKAAAIANCNYNAFRDRLDYGLRCLVKQKIVNDCKPLRDSMLWLVLKIF